MISFKGKRHLKELILMVVRWYLAYALSYRDIEELLLERHLKIDHSTINRWVIEYSPQLSEAFKKKRKTRGVSWRMDETYGAPTLRKLQDAIHEVRAKLEYIKGDIRTYLTDVHCWLCSNESRSGSDLQNICRVM